MIPNAPRICLSALLLQSPLDGIGNYCFYLIRDLLRQNPDWKFSLLVNKTAAEHFRVFADKLEILEVDLTRTDARLLYLHGFFPFRLFRFDLVHSVANQGLLWAPIPQVITVHDTYEHLPNVTFTWLKRKQLMMMKSVSGLAAAAILADSENTREDMGKFYPYLLEKIQVVHLGAKFPVDTYVKTPRRHFLSLGILDSGKNLKDVLDAYALFPSKAEHRLVLFGGRDLGPLIALLESMGLREHVDIHGYVSDETLQGLFRSALAFIRAPSYEGFGLPVVEAMACGCPVIIASNSSLAEIGAGAALFFETHDVEGLAARMVEVAGDPVLADTCVRKSLARAQDFTWEKAAAETTAIYRRVLSASKPVPKP
jgi:glycosyltransferase involved in cell wall biosynthesis